MSNANNIDWSNLFHNIPNCSETLVKNSMRGGGIGLKFILPYKSYSYYVQPFPVFSFVQHAYVFVKICSHVCVNAKSYLGLSTYTFPSPCHLFRRAGAGAWRRATASLLIADAWRLPWCPAGTAAVGRCQTGRKKKDTKLIITMVATNLRCGGNHIGPSQSLCHLIY